MIDTQAFQEFKRALTLLRAREPERALEHLRRAVDLDKQNPFYLSYLGLTLARAKRKWGEAENLCETALRMRRNEAQLYLNLAEVYVIAGRRQDAAETLAMGLKYARRDSRLERMLNRLAVRRRPVLPFLGRKHFLNRHLGRMRHQALSYLQTA